MNPSEKINIDPILKAREVFESFRKDMVTERDKAGAVQAFEFSYELAWKLMKRVLESRGLEVGSPKDTFRQAVHERLIENPEIWFEFQKKRNLTVHTYRDENLENILSIFDIFSAELNKFIEKLKILT